MIYIAHRGMINGPNEEFENSPIAIDEAIANGFDVEIDIWVNDINERRLFLGHDTPKHEIDWNWLYDRAKRLWVHCKNATAISVFHEINLYRSIAPIHHFWHQQDTLTLTSLGYIWAYPGKQPIKYSIAVMPETYNDNLSQCIGICSDYVLKYRMQDKTN